MGFAVMGYSKTFSNSTGGQRFPLSLKSDFLEVAGDGWNV